jgi:hypothetical protein
VRQARLCWPPVEVVSFPLALLPLIALLSVGCRVDTDAFQKRLFACGTGANDPLCGTDSHGEPMTCFAARSLGGTFDFCTEKCEQPMSLPDENAVCVQGNAKLKACDPTTDQGPDGGVSGPGPCGDPQLGCMRTDVVPYPGAAEEGVCVTGHPCLDDKDCGDPVKSTCAATFLQQLYDHASAANLHGDHLYCLQKGCKLGSSYCSPGESCLPNFIPPVANPPDICVPNCDSHDQCPPNFFCYRKNSGPANPPICIPGLLGFVCSSDVDCMMGKCMSDDDPPGQGLNLCTIPCARDSDCTVYDSLQGRFVCSPDGHCITPEAYRGASCNVDDDCVRDVGTVCVWPPPGPTDDPKNQGTCLRPCMGDPTSPTCEARGQIGHTCLPFVSKTTGTTAVCYPGYFGLPCADQSQCAVPELQCPGGLNFCTRVCANDGDCEGDRWTAGQSYCAGNFCAPLTADGKECQMDNECASKHCVAAGAGVVTSPPPAKKVCAVTGATSP